MVNVQRSIETFQYRRTFASNVSRNWQFNFVDALDFIFVTQNHSQHHNLRCSMELLDLFFTPCSVFHFRFICSIFPSAELMPQFTFNHKQNGIDKTQSTNKSIEIYRYWKFDSQKIYIQIHIWIWIMFEFSKYRGLSWQIHTIARQYHTLTEITMNGSLQVKAISTFQMFMYQCTDGLIEN